MKAWSDSKRKRKEKWKNIEVSETIFEKEINIDPKSYSNEVVEVDRDKDISTTYIIKKIVL